MARAPIGRLTRNSEGQRNQASSSPPMVGPAANDAATIIELIPSAAPSSRAGKIWRYKAGTMLIAAALPMPWIKRNAFRDGSDHAREQPREDAVKTASPQIYSRR